MDIEDLRNNISHGMELFHANDLKPLVKEFDLIYDALSCVEKKIDHQAKVIDAQKIEIVTLWAALHEVIDYTPNDTDFPDKPNRDECLREIKHFAQAALTEQRRINNAYSKAKSNQI